MWAPRALKLPKIVQVHGGAAKELHKTLQTLKLKKPFLVADPFLATSGALKYHITDHLDAHQVPYTLWDKVVPDPTTGSIADALSAFSAPPLDARCDCAVGIGGGSAIDTAKALSCQIEVAESGRKLRDVKVPAEAPAAIPILAIPTTAGTGSEVTRVTVVSDTETHEKMLLAGDSMLPTAALVDYELTETKPRRVTADTGIDALCHAMEAYVSRLSNIGSDALGLEALRVIPSMLPRACANPADSVAREALMLASTRAGAAFSNSSVTLIHGMSRPLGVHFGVPHGMSNAMLLPAVTAFSISGAPSRYADCARAMSFAAADDADEAACTRLVAMLRDLTSSLDVPTLQGFGVSRERFLELVPQMAAQAIASGSPANNPVVPSEEQVRELYLRVWDEGEARG